MRSLDYSGSTLISASSDGSLRLYGMVRAGIYICVSVAIIFDTHRIAAVILLHKACHTYFSVRELPAICIPGAHGARAVLSSLAFR